MSELKYHNRVRPGSAPWMAFHRHGWPCSTSGSSPAHCRRWPGAIRRAYGLGLCRLSSVAAADLLRARAVRRECGSRLGALKAKLSGRWIDRTDNKTIAISDEPLNEDEWIANFADRCLEPVSAVRSGPQSPNAAWTRAHAVVDYPGKNHWRLITLVVGSGVGIAALGRLFPTVQWDVH